MLFLVCVSRCLELGFYVLYIPHASWNAAKVRKKPLPYLWFVSNGLPSVKGECLPANVVHALKLVCDLRNGCRYDRGVESHEEDAECCSAENEDEAGS